MKVEKLRRITSEIIESACADGASASVDERRAAFEAKYPKFASKYPKLFEMCCSCNGDAGCDAKTRGYIDFLLGMLERTREDSMSTHDASVCVGQRLYDDFVAPAIGRS